MIYPSERSPFRFKKDMAIVQKVRVITMGKFYDSDEIPVPKIRYYPNVNCTCHCNQANDP